MPLEFNSNAELNGKEEEEEEEGSRGKANGLLYSLFRTNISGVIWLRARDRESRPRVFFVVPVALVA